MATRESYTTVQIAKIAGVSRATATVWCDSGGMVSHRIPGGGRRVFHRDLVDFLKSKGMPSVLVNSDRWVNCLFVGSSRLIESASRDLPASQYFRVSLAWTAFDAGVLMVETTPHIVIVEASLGREECRSIAACCRLKRPHTIRLLIRSDDQADEVAEQFGYTHSISQFCNPAELSQIVRDLARCKESDHDKPKRKPQRAKS